ncbi:hypothetical protein GCM10010455_00640 [Microbacterium esteraromaticum]
MAVADPARMSTTPTATRTLIRTQATAVAVRAPARGAAIELGPPR